MGRSAKDRPGAGAAGGLGFALQLLGAHLRSGAEVIADLLRLDAALDGDAAAAKAVLDVRSDVAIARRVAHLDPAIAVGRTALERSVTYLLRMKRLQREGEYLRIARR